jgi:Prophage tail length tape measure protein
MTTNTTIIRFVGEDEASNVAQGIDKSMAGLSSSADAVSTKFSAFNGIAAGALQAVGGALTNLVGQGFSALSGVITSSIAESQGWQSALAQTEAVVKSTGGAAGFTAAQLGDMASAMSASAGKSMFSDDAILGAENVLATFTQIKGVNFTDATSAILDVSQALGQDLQGTAIQVGKALNDPVQGISALSRVGVSFSEDQKAAIKALVETGDVAGAQQLIIAELNKEFGGSAAAAVDTYAGRQAVLTEKMNDAKQRIGDALLPVLTQLTDVFVTKLLPYVDQGAQMFATFISSLPVDQIEAFMGTIATGVDSAIGGFDEFKLSIEEALETMAESETAMSLANAFENIGTVLMTVGSSIATNVQPLLLQLWYSFNAIVDALAPVYEAMSAVFADPAVLSALDGLVQIASLLGQVVFAGLAAYVQILADAFMTHLMPGIQTAMTVISTVINAVFPVVKGILESLVLYLNGDTTGAMTKLSETFSTVWENIKKVVQGGVDYIVTALKTKIEEAKQLGTDIVKGIASGIDLGVSFVKEAIERVLGAALQKARDWGLIESPSRKFAAMVGEPIGQGMAQGIINTTGLVADASSMAVGNAGAVTTYNYNLNASYATVQSEGNIMQDLRAMQILGGAV